jgi:hypothetical protein
MTELNTRLHTDESHNCVSTACSRQHWSQNAGMIAFAAPVNIILPGELNYASMYTYAAGREILCHPMPVSDEMPHRLRFEVVLQAPSNRTELRDPDNPCTLLLRQKIRTLIYVLDKVMGPEGECLDTSLWQVILNICGKLQYNGR